MRLIDADKMIEELDLKGRSLDVVMKQQTAYDIDKIVEQLEEKSHYTNPTYDEDGHSMDDEEEVVDLDVAIEIVKAGGKNE